MHVIKIYSLLYMCRWLKASGVSIACEEGMQKIARDIIGESQRGDFNGEELRGAPLVWMPNLNQMVLHLLEENLRYLITYVCHENAC